MRSEGAHYRQATPVEEREGIAGLGDQSPMVLIPMPAEALLARLRVTVVHH